jgi:hypothetical protein
MSDEIGVTLSSANVRPGARLEGQAGWQLAKAPKHVSIRLFWRTSGKGTQDLAVVEERKIEAPQAAQLLPFAFDLPIGPYSFEGRLITLQWGVEILADKASHCAWFELGPDGKACRLQG